MSRFSHLHPADLHGLSRLAVDGVIGTTTLVEQLHGTIARTAVPVPAPESGRTRGITGLVYRSIHGITGLVGSVADLAFDQVVPRLPTRHSTAQRERLVAILNGVVGDHLDETANPLAIRMKFRRQGRPFSVHSEAIATAIDPPGRKLLIALHGLCMNELQWSGSQGEGQRNLVNDLAASLDFSPVFLHYNSGRHISTNGREFADYMENLVEQWPEPVEEIVLLGYSMGGLVARSACHYAERADQRWLNRVTRLVTVGSPHHGSPAERLGNQVDRLLNLSPYSAPFARLGRMRSAGITDLRHGNLRDQDWADHDRFSRSGDQRQPVNLPEHVKSHAIAGITGSQPDSIKSRLLGDGLVPVDSALGLHRDPTLQFPTADDHRWVARNTGHLDLIHSRSVYQRIHDWL